MPQFAQLMMNFLAVSARMMLISRAKPRIMIIVNTCIAWQTRQATGGVPTLPPPRPLAQRQGETKPLAVENYPQRAYTYDVGKSFEFFRPFPFPLVIYRNHWILFFLSDFRGSPSPLAPPNADVISAYPLHVTTERRNLVEIETKPPPNRQALEICIWTEVFLKFAERVARISHFLSECNW